MGGEIDSLVPLDFQLIISLTQSKSFPMLSTSIFSSNGSIYQQSAVFDQHFNLNETALDEVGLPSLTGSNAWNNLVANLAVSTLLFELVHALSIQRRSGV